MNLQELIINKDQIVPFILSAVLTIILYKYLEHKFSISIELPILIFLIYIIFIIVYRIVNTNTDFSKPLVNYIITKKNFREEPYQINYINPFVTNLDKVDFNMRRNTNKKYIKRKLNELLMRKYVNFENVLAYNKNPWEIIKLTKSGSKYKLNEELTDTLSIKDNKYCMNYIDDTDYSDPDRYLILYRKHILKFINKTYFIFERKNKAAAKYVLSECISQLVFNPETDGDFYTIIDTRDLHYDRQYILFDDFDDFVPKDRTPPITPLLSAYNTPYKKYDKCRKIPTKYYWQNDTKIRQVFVIDIHFISNDMVILDENRNLQNSMNEGGTDETTADFSLNKYYDKQDWIKKRYFNLVKYQFNNRIAPKNLFVFINDEIDDISTIKFRTILGKKSDSVITSPIIKIYINRKNTTDEDRRFINELEITPTSNNSFSIDFERYIKKHIQDKEVQANELVMVKDKNTKFDKDNNLTVDKNTVSYVSFNFLNIKNITEYRNKMAYIADSIMEKYFPDELKSIDKIKYNTETLGIIQLDNLFRYDRGRQRLVLNNSVITPNNIGMVFKDIKKLRQSYIAFLDRILQYREKVKTMVKEKTYNLNVSNNELIKVLNTNVFNTKDKFLAIIYKIESASTSLGYTLEKTLTKLHILEKANGYNEPKSTAHFVKFNQIMNIDGFNINSNNVYIIHRTQLSTTLKPQAFYLEEYLLEPDLSGNEIKLSPPKNPKTLLKYLRLYDCTNMFRKETIGVCNVIKILDNTRFTITFDNVPLEFKSLLGGDTTVSSNNMFIDRPTFVMLNFTKNNAVNEISHNIFENSFYRVVKIRSTTSSNSAELTLVSNYNLDKKVSADDETDDTDQNFIYKDILVSQYINSKDFIENVYFKKIDIKKSDRLLSDGPSFKFEVSLKNQIININPPIYRNNIIDDYETTMLQIVEYIYENEAKKIHYEIPANIGIYKDTTGAVYSYKYKNELYITYDKRNSPINYFKNTNSEYICKKIYKGENFSLNITSLYNLDSYQEYYKYFKNLFKNILGLHSEINYQCDEYYKSGSMLSNLKLPITFNKYVTFSSNFMLYYKKDQLLDDIDPPLLGKHVVINNTVLDNHMLNSSNSNRRNSIIYKRFMKDIIYTYKIGRKGFEYDDAKKICERIFTIYDKKCKQPVYKIQGNDYNINYYKNNKKRDQCFNIVYNDKKELDNAQFIAKIKGFDPTSDNQDADITDITDIKWKNIDRLKSKYYKLHDDTDNLDQAKHKSSFTFRTDYLGEKIQGNKTNKKLKSVQLAFHAKITDASTWLTDKIETSNKVIFKQYPNNYYIGDIELYNSDLRERVKITNLLQLPYTGFNKEGYTWKNIESHMDTPEINSNVSTSLDATTKNTSFEFKFVDTHKVRPEVWSKLILRNTKGSDNKDDIKTYTREVEKLKKIGNIDVKPHRLAHLNEVKTAAYYTADWDNIAWINDANPLLFNKSNLIKVQDKKVLWFDKDDENAINKGVVCYGRKLDQNKIAQNQKNEIYNFQMEKIEQNIKDIQTYENVSKFNKEVYSRWNL